MYKKYFNIETPITYLNELHIPDKYKQSFHRSWKRFYRTASPIISEFRTKRFDAFFRQLQKDGSDERYASRISIRFINPSVGYGAFANEAIPPYSTLCQYTGILMKDSDINPDHDSTFSFTDYKSFSIDAATQGNWARFMNHAEESSSTNNAIPWEHYLEDGPRIVFTSGSKGIQKGNQILYSYGNEYWEDKKCLTL